MVTTRRKPDAVLVGAAEDARAVLVAEVGTDQVGEHQGQVSEGDRVVSHLFGCTRPGYRGWHWSVTITRALRQKRVTVDEIVLIPGDDAIVAPPWVPYRDRVEPGDLSPGDLLPVADDDPRLVPTYSFGDDPLDSDEKAQIRQVAGDLGLGRTRTLSVEGRDLAAQRWYDGEPGPGSALAKAAPSTCRSCGFLLRLAGPLSDTFGVCANGDANDDARVVAFDHGCGAHSEARLGRKQQPVPLPEPVVDTMTPDEIEGF